MHKLASAVLAASTLVLAPAPATGATAQSAGVVDCRNYVHDEINIVISSARNMRCRAAERDMERYRGPIRRRFKTPGGFRCLRVSGGAYGGQWRCVKGGRAYRFDFGD